MPGPVNASHTINVRQPFKLDGDDVKGAQIPANWKPVGGQYEVEVPMRFLKHHLVPDPSFHLKEGWNYNAADVGHQKFYVSEEGGHILAAALQDNKSNPTHVNKAAWIVGTSDESSEVKLRGFDLGDKLYAAQQKLANGFGAGARDLIVWLTGGDQD